MASFSCIPFVSDTTAERNACPPKLSDLYSEVIPKYATYWEDLGIKLGLKKHHIDIISENNAFNPNRVTACCKSVLKKWLEIDHSATGEKLRNAIRTISKQGE